jgi:ligand-binding sensor domain-containing protein/class 3 adenylate cyclase
LLLVFGTLFLSCKEERKGLTGTDKDINSTKVSPKITIISELPDSLRPHVIDLKTMPAPETHLIVGASVTGTSEKAAVKGSGEAAFSDRGSKMLPLLNDENGNPVLGTDGKPFILGAGGKSHFTNFTAENGLALDAICSSLTDRMGNLWFGTLGGGVSRYDGKTFTNFTTTHGLANNTVFSMYEDRNGILWFGTGGGGVSRYDGRSFVTFNSEDGLTGDYIWSIEEDKKGNLWFGTQGAGVSCYDGKTFTNFKEISVLSTTTVTSVFEDRDGIFWFGTNGSGVLRYDGNTFTEFNEKNGLGSNAVHSIIQDRNGFLWFGTHNGGVSRFDGKSLITFTNKDGLANNKVKSIIEDRSGNLWFGTLGGGISRYDGKSFVTFTANQGLASNEVWSITEDRSGNIWISTAGGGVSHYNGKAFTNFSKTHGLVHNTVWSIDEDLNGDLWLSTESGISRYNGLSFTNFTTDQGLPDDFIYQVVSDRKGDLWLATAQAGVAHISGNRISKITTDQGLLSNEIWCIMEDSKGSIWIGTNHGGVSKYDGSFITNYTSDQGLAGNSVSCIKEDSKGFIWFGTQFDGVSRFDGNSFVNYTIEQGLADNAVNSIIEDKNGNMWLATMNGISVLSFNVSNNNMVPAKSNDAEGAPSSMINTFTAKDGLPDDKVTGIIPLPDGRIAAGTNNGVAIFEVSDDLKSITEVAVYNTKTGYPVKDVNAGQATMFIDKSGVLWIGTGSDKTALVRFDYASLQKSTDPPRLVIQSVQINETNVCWYNLETGNIRRSYNDSITALLQEYLAYGKALSDAENDSILKRFGGIKFDSITSHYPIPQNLVLPYKNNHVTFEFAAIETDRPFMVKYQYFLEGYDSEWSPVTNRSNASFGNIREGFYTFKLRAQGPNGVWCEPIAYSFEVLPPWYRTWWAALIYLGLFIAAIGIYIKWRERKLRLEKEKLEHTVQERTEELVQKNKIIEMEKQRSDDLLLNILPEEVAEELKVKGSAEARQFDEVTVLFTDFKNFTQITEKMSAKELVEEIHTCFKAFDNIIGKYGIEKIKTIGDSYMCAGGLPIPSKTHAEDVIRAALEIKDYVENRAQHREAAGVEPFHIRIGIHTGPVVAGIVGVKKFAYDIWGDTVNTASRMESSGENGKINISETTYGLIRNKFKCVYRGKIQTKGKGEMDMYFVEDAIGGNK